MKLLTSNEILKLPIYECKMSGKYACCVEFHVNRDDFSRETDFRHMMHTLKNTAKNKFSQYGIGPEAYDVSSNRGILRIEFDHYDIFVYLISKFQKYLTSVKGPVSKKHAEAWHDAKYIVTEKKIWYRYVVYLRNPLAIKNDISKIFPNEDDVYRLFGTVRIRKNEDLILFKLTFNDHIYEIKTVISIPELIE